MIYAKAVKTHLFIQVLALVLKRNFRKIVQEHLLNALWVILEKTTTKLLLQNVATILKRTKNE